MKKYSEHLSRNWSSSNDVRIALVELLNKQLADTVDLRSQARQAEFNVRGPYFQELRSLFDGLALELRHLADLIAQRITSCGGTAAASVRFAAQESTLREYPGDAVDARDHLEALLSSYSRYEFDTRHNLKTVQEKGDMETTGLLEAVLTSVERDLWFLEAYLEGIVVGLNGRKLPVWSSTFEDRSEGAASTGAA